MGWFSKKKTKKPTTTASALSKPQQVAQKPPFAAPPNVYAARPQQPPPQQHQHQLPQQRPLPRPNLPYGHQYGAQSQPHFQPAGYLPAPSGWTPPVPTYQPVIVNHQHYYMGGGQQQQQQPQQQLHHSPPSNPSLQPPHPLHPPQHHPYQQQQQQHQQPQQPQQPHQPQHHHSPLGRFTGSMVNLTKEMVPAAIPQLYDDGLSVWHGCNQLATSTAAKYDQVYSRFNNVMTLIDTEMCHGNENDLFNCHSGPEPEPQSSASITTSPPLAQDRGFSSKPKKSVKPKKSQSSNVASCVVSGNYFSKVEFYANSKLPRDLPRLALYHSTWPILTLAARYSQRVYDRPKGAELDAHVSGDWLTGTKAMCIKSVPMDHMNTIVFAIRGTASFMDWAVNLNTAPVSPLGFLDDPGNLCHAGFLSVAKKMVRPVAARLRQLLREDPSRSKYSLLITGHSAGGAVAALLYSHMLAETNEAESELNILTGRFKRIHCVTFGTPPVSLLPLTKPAHPHLKNSLFLSFVNEGDPVVRADKAYVKSLIELLTSPVPLLPSTKNKDQRGRKGSSDSRKSRSKSAPASKSRSRSDSTPEKPRWTLPPCTLSNAGRLIVLRSGDAKARPKDRKTVSERLKEGVVAATCQEEQLRSVIWGDPVCHLMSLYAGRVEALAVESVTGKGR
ncbi:hypothetical protein AK830_g8734 [Neonectria ditissima]|uniref:Fungal lipase-type domain-containing protein n=1 Tax=Neonectria ditissima TaxID=78410 RepID=A0A0P7BAN0_9HYPO|nr:hypothetical protein AK830_g8734 [Neonectria ditissima]